MDHYTIIYLMNPTFHQDRFLQLPHTTVLILRIPQHRSSTPLIGSNMPTVQPSGHSTGILWATSWRQARKTISRASGLEQDQGRLVT
jgi:hypothetical protein